MKQTKGISSKGNYIYEDYDPEQSTEEFLRQHYQQSIMDLKNDVQDDSSVVKSKDTKCDECVCHPPHYTWLKELCGIEVIDITRHMDFDLGNAIKYILRQGHKSERGMSDKAKAIQDLQKAVWYIEDKIKMLEKDDTK